MRLDWTRVMRASGLIAWAAFFDWLWLTGRGATYVGPRTSWVVVFGAITLTGAAVLYAAGVRTRHRTKAPPVGELGRLGIIVAPILLAIMAPAVSLGAQAVEMKQGAEGAASTERLADHDGEVRLYELAAAAVNPRWAAERGIEPGLEVDFNGFVSRTEQAGRVELSRFIATCCAADAVPYTVEVELPQGAPELRENDWVQVRGMVIEGPGEPAFQVTAEAVAEIDRPADFYG